MFSKLQTLLWVSIYFIGFDYIYVQHLYPSFGYLGQIDFVRFDAFKFIIVYLCIIIPVFWLPQKIERPTQTIFWFIYTLVYIPTLTFVANSIETHFYEICLYMILGNAVFGLSYQIKLVDISIFQVQPAKLIKFIYISLGIICLALLITQYDKIAFANPLDGDAVYDQRLRDDINLGWLLYPFVLSNSVLLPLFWLYGIYLKNYKILFAASMIQVFLYTIFANKSYLITIFFVYVVYKMLIKTNEKFGLKITQFLTIVIVIGGFLLSYTFEKEEYLTIKIISLLFILRGIGIGIINFSLYYDYFINLNNPLTYLSHVGIFSKIIKYPYEKDLGLVIGEFYYNSDTSNPNANFIITDGISAFGLPGILISCIICAIIFWFLDVMSQKHNIAFSSALFVTSAMFLINTSLFTTLLSGGLGILGVILWIMPPVSNKFIKKK